MTTDDSELASLRRRLDAEEAAYADLLSAIDRLVQFPLPLERLPEQPELMQRLNALCVAPPAPSPGGLLGRVWGRIWAQLAPRLERQQEFNAALVRVLNGQLEEGARLHAHLRDLAATLVRYFQRLLPLVDARDRLSSALTTTRGELILEAFDRRQEMLARRIDGLVALRDRLEAVASKTQTLADVLAAGAPPPAVAATVRKAVEDAAYVAFENRFRGSQEEIAERLAPYVELFRAAAPVIDLGCGRGEFLDLLKAAGIAATGVDGNASCVTACRTRGHEVLHGDLVEHLRAQGDRSAGGLFAAQVAEHLPPRALVDLLREAARVLRQGGLLVLETVNPRSVIAFVDIYTRDLTHERPLHPETLRFLAAAAGFSDVRIEWRSPVDPSSRLAPIPPDTLPPLAVQRMNENVERLNALLYAPQEYALVARR